MNLETKITIYKFTPQLFTLTHNVRPIIIIRATNPCITFMYISYLNS